MTEKTLSFEELGITAADVYEQMGYHDAQTDKATQQETAMILKEVSQWLRPRFSYFVVNKQPDFVPDYTALVNFVEKIMI